MSKDNSKKIEELNEKIFSLQMDIKSLCQAITATDNHREIDSHEKMIERAENKIKEYELQIKELKNIN